MFSLIPGSCGMFTDVEMMSYRASTNSSDADKMRRTPSLAIIFETMVMESWIRSTWVAIVLPVLNTERTLDIRHALSTSQV